MPALSQRVILFCSLRMSANRCLGQSSHGQATLFKISIDAEDLALILNLLQVG